MSFGGPAGQIALMHKLLVEEKRWVSEQRFLSGLTSACCCPVRRRKQLATYIGWLLHGTRGALAAGTLFILPGFFVILTLSALYAAFHSAAWLGDLFFGLKCAIIAIVLEAVMRIGKRALKNGAMVAISGAAFAAIFVFGAPFPAIVLGAAILGYLVARRWPSVLAREAGEDTPGAPAALRRGWLRAFKIVAVASVLWGGAHCVQRPRVWRPKHLHRDRLVSSRRRRSSPSAAPMRCSPMSRSKRRARFIGCRSAKCSTA